jgi:hypothetical protein
MLASCEASLFYSATVSGANSGDAPGLDR